MVACITERIMSMCGKLVLIFILVTPLHAFDWKIHIPRPKEITQLVHGAFKPLENIFRFNPWKLTATSANTTTMATTNATTTTPTPAPPLVPQIIVDNLPGDSGHVPHVVGGETGLVIGDPEAGEARVEVPSTG